MEMQSRGRGSIRSTELEGANSCDASFATANIHTHTHTHITEVRASRFVCEQIASRCIPAESKTHLLRGVVNYGRGNSSTWTGNKTVEKSV